MSVVTCSRCDALIDSDDDPDCFVSDGKGGDVIACERCRYVMEYDGELDVETNTLREGV